MSYSISVSDLIFFLENVCIYFTFPSFVENFLFLSTKIHIKLFLRYSEYISDMQNNNIPDPVS